MHEESDQPDEQNNQEPIYSEQNIDSDTFDIVNDVHADSENIEHFEEEDSFDTKSGIELQENLDQPGEQNHDIKLQGIRSSAEAM